MIPLHLILLESSTLEEFGKRKNKILKDFVINLLKSIEMKTIKYLASSQI